MPSTIPIEPYRSFLRTLVWISIGFVFIPFLKILSGKKKSFENMNVHRLFGVYPRNLKEETDFLWKESGNSGFNFFTKVWNSSDIVYGKGTIRNSQADIVTNIINHSFNASWMLKGTFSYSVCCTQNKALEMLLQDMFKAKAVWAPHIRFVDVRVTSRLFHVPRNTPLPPRATPDTCTFSLTWQNCQDSSYVGVLTLSHNLSCFRLLKTG